MVLRRCPALVVALLALLMGGCGSEASSDTGADPSRWGTLALPAASSIAVPAPVRGSAPIASGSAGTGNPVVPWIERALRSVAQHTKNPPAASRGYAMVSVAMHDAAVAAAHWQKAHERVEPGYPSTAAAIAGAASRSLAVAFPEEPASRLDADAEEIADAQVAGGRSSRGAAAAGLRLGREVARRVIARTSGDRTTGTWRGRAPRGRRRWRPPDGSVARPVAPLAADWATWLLPHGAAVRPPPPPAYGSAAYLAAAREVVRVGRSLTPEQKRIAQFWAGGEATGLPPGIWNQVLVQIVRERRLGAARSARAFALLNVAMADAGVAVWDAKYAYWTARPVNAVRDLGVARDWEPLLSTPLFPSYPSGHAAYSAAAADVLGHLYDDQRPLFRTKAGEAALSRLYGGLHFRFDNDAGLRLGHAIGARAVAWDREDRGRP